MTAMTFSSLSNDLEVYCEREDAPFIDQIPRFISLAENRIASESKPLGYVRTVTGTLNGVVLAKPVRWRKTKNLSIMVGSARTYMKNRSYEYLRRYWPDSSLTGVPFYYADYDYEHLFIAPSPALTYTFEMQYYELPEPLTQVNQTNWTTQYAPQLLLYAAMMEAMVFLKVPERIPELQALYDRALGAIVKEDQQRALDSAAVRG